MNIVAKKSLGQNFLIDREVLEQIVATTDITNKEILLDDELAKAQEAFSKKHNVTLVENEIQLTC